MMPEEHNLPFGNFLGSLQDKFNYIVKISKQISIADNTYLLLYLSFLGLISSALNQAK